MHTVLSSSLTRKLHLFLISNSNTHFIIVGSLFEMLLGKKRNRDITAKSQARLYLSFGSHVRDLAH